MMRAGGCLASWKDNVCASTDHGLMPALCSCGAAVQSWIATMAAYVKGLDPGHLLSVGSEGFYSPADAAQADANPQGANS